MPPGLDAAPEVPASPACHLPLPTHTTFPTCWCLCLLPPAPPHPPTHTHTYPTCWLICRLPPPHLLVYMPPAPPPPPPTPPHTHTLPHLLVHLSPALPPRILLPLVPPLHPPNLDAAQQVIAPNTLYAPPSCFRNHECPLPWGPHPPSGLPTRPRSLETQRACLCVCCYCPQVVTWYPVCVCAATVAFLLCYILYYYINVPPRSVLLLQHCCYSLILPVSSLAPEP